MKIIICRFLATPSASALVLVLQGRLLAPSLAGGVRARIVIGRRQPFGHLPVSDVDHGEEADHDSLDEAADPPINLLEGLVLIPVCLFSIPGFPLLAVFCDEQRVCHHREHQSEPDGDHVKVEKQDQAGAEQRRDGIHRHELHVLQEGPAQVHCRGREVGQFGNLVPKAYVEGHDEADQSDPKHDQERQKQIESCPHRSDQILHQRQMPQVLGHLAPKKNAIEGVENANCRGRAGQG
mmetsp:Transcript_116218/g.276244  ORF Transcript_116218/g.276244 Transcript_116218/m.276244 type:complete len:237 (+) Transcript_116218:301-1011(+)